MKKPQWITGNPLRTALRRTLLGTGIALIMTYLVLSTLVMQGPFVLVLDQNGAELGLVAAEIAMPELLSITPWTVIAGKMLFLLHPQSPGITQVRLMLGGEELMNRVMQITPSRRVFDLTTGNFTGCEAIIISLFLLSLLGMMYAITSVKAHQKHHFYSYGTMHSMAMGFFTMTFTIIYATLILRFVLDPAGYNMNEVLDDLLDSCYLSMVINLPILLVFAIALSVSNASLIRHEGFHPFNTLGMMLSFVLAILAVMGVWCHSFMHHGDRSFGFYALQCLMTTTYMYVSSMLFGAMSCGLMATKRTPKTPMDYVIVLGCQLSRDGSPTPLLRARCDRALSFAKAQTPPPVLIGSGGQGQDEAMPEGKAICDYLSGQGWEDAYLLKEDKSTSTLENMQFSRRLMTKSDPKIAFVTTNYHLFRAGMKAQEAGFEAEGLGAKTKWYFWPNAFIREFIGLMVRQIPLHVVMVGVMTVLFCGLAWMIIR